MNRKKEKVILARTSPRLKRSAASTARVGMDVDKCATDSTTQRLNRRNSIKIGEWNVRGLNAIGKLSIISNEMERLDIKACGLSETKWAGAGHFKTVDGHTVLFSGKERGEREHHGVAIWIHRNTATCLTSYNPVSNRLLTATFAAKPRDITMIQCYAPTVGGSDGEIEQLHKEVHQAIAETPKRN